MYIVILTRMHEIGLLQSCFSVCGQTDFAYFKRKRVGPQNMMIIRFDSATYSDVTPGSGFNLTVRTLASGMIKSSVKHKMHNTSKTDTYAAATS